MKQPAVYIMAGQRNGLLYVGVTADLVKRVNEYKSHAESGLGRRHVLATLLYYELHADMDSAITRQQQINQWPRLWRRHLIAQANPEWRDLYERLKNGVPASTGSS